ncbi:HTTM domain-containing protein [Actinomycetospora sp. TBRC 11914]|uniref:HTTM domain-containing protein n=1 Tax=Actinomycetospora sp. TBRC 11914 TaxID=2729387 RepID=UPI00145FA793|nr:HTTM domain-containing protein [Actinomycetospora sp. TBRC 11914]NMO88639.1 HTTM domain-containing protein [Actinomycetospora sp. TBRC 11914]
MSAGALVRGAGERVWGAWERFFFTPESTAPLAVFRIAYGIVITLWTLTQLPHLFVFYGPDGVLPTPPAVSAGQWGVLTMVNSVPVLAVVWLATLLSGLALLVGTSPRIAAIVLLVGMVALTRRDPYVLNSGDILLRVLAVYLVFAPSAESLSWDRWRRDREHFWEFPRRAPWAMRMLQVQLSVIYLAAVWAKLQGDVWRNGTAITYALRMLDQLRLPTPGFVAGSPLLVEWFTFGTLLTELSIGLFVWNRRARWWVLGAGFLMHLSIELFIMVGFFSIGMWCLYLVFLPPEGTDRAVLALRDRRRARRADDARPPTEREAATPEPSVTES